MPLLHGVCCFCTIINNIACVAYSTLQANIPQFKSSQCDWQRCAKCCPSSWTTHPLLLLHVCRYVRIVGTHNTVNKVFHLVAFECMFTNRSYTLDNGLVGKFLKTPKICPPLSTSKVGAVWLGVRVKSFWFWFWNIMSEVLMTKSL